MLCYVQVTIIVTVMANQRDDTYNAIKKLCYIELGIPEQNVIGRTLRDHKKLRSITIRIAQQINAKLGGLLWHVKIPMVSYMYFSCWRCNTVSKQLLNNQSVFVATSHGHWDRHIP